MSAPRLRVEPSTPELPDLAHERIPAWRFTKHAVLTIVSCTVLLALAGLVVATTIPVSVVVQADGVLEPAVVWPVRSPDPGLISRIAVRTGDSVRGGQIVAQLDNSELNASVRDLVDQIEELRLEQARMLSSAHVDSAKAIAEIATAEAHVAQAKTELRQKMADFSVQGDVDSVVRASANRVHVGLDGPSAAVREAEAEVSAARTTLASVGLASLDVQHKRIEISRLQTSLATARAKLVRSTVESPVSGIVLTDQLDRLQGADVSAGQEILEIGDPLGWRATVVVADRDIYKLRIGDSADVEVTALAALPDDRFRGRIVSLGWQPANQSATGQPSGYRVEIELDPRRMASSAVAMMRRGYPVHTRVVARSETGLNLFVDYVRERRRGGS